MVTPISENLMRDGLLMTNVGKTKSQTSHLFMVCTLYHPWSHGGYPWLRKPQLSPGAAGWCLDRAHRHGGPGSGGANLHCGSGGAYQPWPKEPKDEEFMVAMRLNLRKFIGNARDIPNDGLWLWWNAERWWKRWWNIYGWSYLSYSLATSDRVYERKTPGEMTIHDYDGSRELISQWLAPIVSSTMWNTWIISLIRFIIRWMAT